MRQPIAAVAAAEVVDKVAEPAVQEPEAATAEATEAPVEKEKEVAPAEPAPETHEETVKAVEPQEQKAAEEAVAQVEEQVTEPVHAPKDEPAAVETVVEPAATEESPKAEVAEAVSVEKEEPVQVETVSEPAPAEPQAKEVPVPTEVEAPVEANTVSTHEEPIPETAKETAPEESAKDSIFSPEVLGAGVATVAAGAAITAGVYAATHKESEVVPEHVESKQDPVQPENTDKAVVADHKPTEPVTEAPSTEQASASNQQPHVEDDAEEQTKKATEPQPATAEPAAPSENAADKAVATKGDEEDRAQSQNRSVTAVSLNRKHDSWFKTILRAVFTNFFGAIFSPFRRRGRNNQ
ncbi:hypothetical protein CBS115988_10390 [Aspergillus niger]|nr:hypothetical protein CBS115988_10390 [Aspergillus niger]